MLLPVAVVWVILFGITIGLECDETKQAKLVKAVNAIFGKAKESKLGFGRPEGIRIDNEKSSVTPAKLEDGSFSIGCPTSANVFVIAAKTEGDNLFSFDIQGHFIKEDLLQDSRRRRKRMCPPIYVGGTGSSKKSSGSGYSSYSLQYDAKQEKNRAALKAEQEKRQSGGAPLEFKTCIRTIQVDFTADTPSVMELTRADDESCTKFTKPQNPETWNMKNILSKDRFIWNKNGFSNALKESEFGMLLSPEDRPAAEAVAECYWKALKEKKFEVADKFPKKTGLLQLICSGSEWAQFKFVPAKGKGKFPDDYAQAFIDCLKGNAEKGVAPTKKASRIWKLIGANLCKAPIILWSLAGLGKSDVAEVADCTIKTLAQRGFQLSIESPKAERLYGQSFQCSKDQGRATFYQLQEKSPSGSKSDQSEEKFSEARVEEIAAECVGKVLKYPTDKQQETMTKEIQNLFDRGCTVKAILEGVVSTLWGKPSGQ